RLFRTLLGKRIKRIMDDATIAVLPVELLCYLLSFLAPRELLQTTELVCKRWKELLRVDSLLWQHVHQRHFGGERRVEITTTNIKSKKESTLLSWRDTCLFAIR